MKLSEVVYEAGEILQYAYFPINCIISLLYVMSDGDSAETAMVGNEGVVGVSLFMGGEATTGRAVVQSDGHAFRLEASILMQEFKLSGALQHLLLRYTQALLMQTTQTAACNKHHSIPQQLCRWLLLGLDRLPDNKLMMTQGLIANMLGVRRGRHGRGGHAASRGADQLRERHHDRARPATAGAGSLRVLYRGQT
jgi:CRP-like cAMP-binding protein